MKNITFIARNYIIFILILSTFMLSGCSDDAGSAGEALSDESPRLTGCTVNAGCDGGEDDQYVEVTLKYDKNISVSGGLSDELRVVIGGERIKTEDMDVSAADSSTDSIVIRMSITRVTNGVIEITSAKGGEILRTVTDENGKYSAEAPDIKKLIPSGVVVETVNSDTSRTTIKVMSSPSHRSMIWIQLYCGGILVEPDDTSSPDVMDGAAGIHEHEFLWATTESTAEDIAEAINSFYSEHFEASSEGDEVTISVKNPSENSGNAELKIYEY